MARYKRYNPNEAFFFVLDPQKILKNNPLVATIHKFVEDHVTPSLFEGKVKNDVTGAPALNPKMMLKVLFYSYAQGIYSSRKIESFLQFDQNLIFLSGDTIFDHSSICNFIAAYSEEIKNVFSKMGYVLATMGYIDFNLVATDGTKIKGYTNRDFNGNISEFKQKKKEIEATIQDLLQKTHLSADQKEEEISVYERRKDAIDEFLRTIEENNVQTMNTKGREKTFNLTDPDARAMEAQKKKTKTVDSRDCKLSTQGDDHYLTCPGERTIKSYKLDHELTAFRSIKYYKFLLSKGKCKGCSYISQCYSNPKRETKRFSVKKEYFDTIDSRTALHKKLMTQEGTQILNKRKGIIEHVFGEIKEYGHFTRFYYRGLPKVRTIWNLMSLAVNLKRISRLGYAL